MKGLSLLGDRRVEVRDYPDPVPGPGEVRVRIARAAVCGTDVHHYKEPASRIEKHKDGGPQVPGHEPSGWVESLGPGTVGPKPGTRVLLAGVMSCGACAWCRRGYNTACENGPYGLAWNHHGADAEYVVVPAANALSIPDSLTFEEATVLTCAGGTAYTLLRETEARAEDRLAILGLGPVGLSLLILAKARGLRCAGLDLSPSRLKLAKDLGLDLALDAGKGDPLPQLKDWSEGLGCDVVGECVGRSETQALALKMAAVRGRVGFAGLGGGPFPITGDQLIGGQLKLIGIAATPIKFFGELINLAGTGLPFGKLVSHRFPLSQAAEAFELMESGKSAKVVFEVSPGA